MGKFAPRVKQFSGMQSVHMFGLGQKKVGDERMLWKIAQEGGGVDARWRPQAESRLVVFLSANRSA